MRLFDEIERSDYGPANHNDNIFDYYQRSAREDISTIRNKLNEWFQNYPVSEQQCLKSSFRDHFEDCFYELFLHQLFLNLGFQIEIHPKLPNTSKRPDFLLRKNDLEIFVEAKIVKNKSKRQEAFERIINKFYDEFSKIKINGFLLDIDEFTIKTKRQPSTKQAIKYIQEEINKADPYELTKQLEQFGLDYLPKISFENEDLKLIVKPLPVVQSARAKENIRPIGIYPIETFCGGGEESLKDAINCKAKRYGKFERPFIICINSLDQKTSGKFDVDDAIWGSLAISWSENPNNHDEKWIRKKDGAFLDEKGPRLTNLSGVFVTKVNPHSIPHSDYWLYENPFTYNGFDFQKLGLIYSKVEKGKIIDRTGNDLGEILRISKDWLNK